MQLRFPITPSKPYSWVISDEKETASSFQIFRERESRHVSAVSLRGNTQDANGCTGQTGRYWYTEEQIHIPIPHPSCRLQIPGLRNCKSVAFRVSQPTRMQLNMQREAGLCSQVFPSRQLTLNLPTNDIGQLLYTATSPL